MGPPKTLYRHYSGHQHKTETSTVASSHRQSAARLPLREQSWLGPFLHRHSVPGVDLRERKTTTAQVETLSHEESLCERCHHQQPRCESCVLRDWRNSVSMEFPALSSSPCAQRRRHTCPNMPPEMVDMSVALGIRLPIPDPLGENAHGMHALDGRVLW